MQFSEIEEFKEKFIPKRKATLLLADSFDRMGLEQRAERCRCCGSILEFSHGIDFDGVISDRSRLHRANFCRDRLCPMCTWRRSLKIFGQVSKVMDYVNWHNYKPVFVTLTVQNCPLDALGDTIDRLYHAFSTMMKTPMFKKSFPGGYLRVLEVTLGRDCESWHPHLHVIFLAHKKYGPRSKYYVSQAELSEIWDSMVCFTTIKAKVAAKYRDCTTCKYAKFCPKFINTKYRGVEYHLEIDDKCGWRNVRETCKDYEPYNKVHMLEPGSAKIVYIELIKPKEKEDFDNSLLKDAILETSKYMCKDSDYIIPGNEELTDKLVASLIIGIGGRRLIQYGGKLAIIHSMLELDDVEDGNLVHVSDDDVPYGDIAQLVVRYGWRCGAYIEMEREVKPYNPEVAVSKNISKKTAKFYKKLEKLNVNDTIRYASDSRSNKRNNKRT